MKEILVNGQESIPIYFDWLIHLLELSVVLGISVVTYVLWKNPKKRNDNESHFTGEK